MSLTDINSLPKSEHDELACTYASLILHDERLDITSDNITKLLKSAGVSVEPYMPLLFARALSGIDISSLLTSAGNLTADFAPSESIQNAAIESKTADDEQRKEPEEEEEEDEDLGFSLFD